MSNPRPANTPWVNPYLTVIDVDKAVKFYQEAFGFTVKEVVPDETGIAFHAELYYKDQLIMMGRQGACGGTTKAPISSGVESPITLCIYCENVDEFHAHAVKQGALSLTAPEDMFWGDRMCRLQDPDHYVWSFATHLGAV